MQELYVALMVSLATIGTMAAMYLYLFKVILPRVIKQSFGQVMEGGANLINAAQDMIRAERKRTFREGGIFASEMLNAFDERLNRIEKILGKLPFSGSTGGKRGGILGGLSKSLGIDLGGVAEGVISNPDTLAQMLQGFTGGPQPATPAPGTPTPGKFTLGP